jgi:predicted ATP-grasp superfamily ATP-dependent carboligase
MAGAPVSAPPRTSFNHPAVLLHLPSTRRSPWSNCAVATLTHVNVSAARTEPLTIRAGAAGGRQLPPSVLVLDAENRQALACLRVFGRAGLGVGAVACRSNASWAPGLRSRWGSLNAVLPDFADDGDAYVDALLELLARYPARVVISAHDGSIEALRRRRTELERVTALALGSEAALDVAVSKERTLALAETLGIATPRSVPLGAGVDLAAALRETGLPAVVKPVQSWAEGLCGGIRLCSNVVHGVEQARQTLNLIRARGGSAILQEWVPGRREAVSLFFAEGRFWARFAQVSYREWPTSGGVSVLCEGIAMPDDAGRDAEVLVRAMDLEGCSMVEFRRDAAGRPVLMEVNPRMGSSVALAIASGVNLPQLLLSWKLGDRLSEVSGYQTGRRLRWLAGDIWNLKCTFENQGDPDVSSRGAGLLRFVADSIRPANALDVFDLHDMRPALAEMNEIVLRHAWKRVQRCFQALAFN